jgi:hypothetical protein
VGARRAWISARSRKPAEPRPQIGPRLCRSARDRSRKQAIRRADAEFSLGNLAFATPGRFDDFGVPGYGLVARAYFGPGGLEAIELRCILTDNEVVRFQPRPCAAREASWVLGRLGDGVALRGEVGVLVR